MADNKNKRSIHLAQTQPQQRRRTNPQPAERMPVKTAIYRTLADLNAGFEQVLLHFKNLQQVGYFPADRLQPLHHLLGRIRAQANCECLTVMHERELANEEYFEQEYRNAEQQAGESAGG